MKTITATDVAVIPVTGGMQETYKRCLYRRHSAFLLRPYVGVQDATAKHNLIPVPYDKSRYLAAAASGFLFVT